MLHEGEGKRRSKLKLSRWATPFACKEKRGERPQRGEEEEKAETDRGEEDEDEEDDEGGGVFGVRWTRLVGCCCQDLWSAQRRAHVLRLSGYWTSGRYGLVR